MAVNSRVARLNSSRAWPGSAPTAAVGDSVLVSGKISDYYPLASGMLAPSSVIVQA